MNILVLKSLLFSLGIPLLRKDLQDPTRSVLRQFTTRLHEIEGVSIDGSNILLANTYAVEIAALTISEDEDGPSSIEIGGYGTIAQNPEHGGFHGRMAMSRSRYSVVANEGGSSISMTARTMKSWIDDAAALGISRMSNTSMTKNIFIQEGISQ
jgi:hypothetical protein